MAEKSCGGCKKTIIGNEGAKCVEAICDDCDHAVDVDGEIGCRFVGVWFESGGERRLVVRPCLLGQRQRDPTLGCANPETPDKWDGARRSIAAGQSAALISIGPESSLESNARACHGHSDGRKPCQYRDGAFCVEGGKRRLIQITRPEFCRIGRWKAIEAPGDRVSQQKGIES